MDACQTLFFGLVTSHLDYANALYIGLPDCDLAKLQHVQNVVAKLVLNKSKYDNATQAFKELHWLPIKFRIIHKILTLVYKSLKGSAPKHLQELLHKQQHCRVGLRSSNDPAITLKVQRTKCKTFADRSFSVAILNCGIIYCTILDQLTIWIPSNQSSKLTCSGRHLTNS